MKIFDFLIKTALLGAFLLFLGDSCHKLRSKIELGNYNQARFSAVICDANPRKKQKGPQK